MKKLIITLTHLLIITSLLAQSPQAFKYQTVVRNATHDILPNQPVGLKISILQGSATGTAVYIETHTDTTNVLGIVNLNIGNGIVQSGNFSAINWGTNSYFIKIELDPAGGTVYQHMGTSQLVSVPYALHAKTAETASYIETDPVFGASPASNITTGNISNWTTAYGWGNHSTAGYLTGNQSITLSGDITGSGATAISTSIANNAVTTAKIANNAVTIAKLPAGATASTYLRGDGAWATPAGTSLPAGTTGQTLRHDGSNWVANSVMINNGTALGIGASPLANTQLHLYRPITSYGAGYSNMTAVRAGSTTAANGGTSWGVYNVDAAIKGFSDWGNNYTAGIAGYSWLDFANSAAVIGSMHSAATWGALAFKDVASTIWAGYFTGNVNITGTMTVQGGTPGAGKVLTSDATGNASWQNIPTGLTGTGSNGKIAFWNGPNNITYNTNFTWDDLNSRLGIGTSSPVAELHVARNNSATNSQVWLKQLGTGDATLGFSIGSSQDWAMGIDQSDGYKFKISPHYTASASPVFTLQTNGRVGLGTTSPTAFFHVDDATNATAYLVRAEFSGSTVTTDPVGFQATCNPSGIAGYGYGASFTAGYKGLAATVSSGTTTFSTYGVDIYMQGSGSGNRYAGYFHTYGGTGNTGSLYGIYSTATGTGTTKYAGYFSGNVTVTGTFSNPSDQSLKTNMKSLNGTIAKLKNLPVYSYEYLPVEGINLPEGSQFGFVAQDLEKIFPELVSVQKHPLDDRNNKEDSKYFEYKGINYIGIIPVLTKAFQEQQEIIEQQNTRIEKLEMLIEQQQEQITVLLQMSTNNQSGNSK